MSLNNAEIFRNDASMEVGRIVSLARSASIIMSKAAVPTEEEAQAIAYDLVEVIHQLSVKAEIALARIETELMRVKSS